MSQQSVVIQLPEEVYRRVKEIAEESNRPLENVLVDSLNLIFGQHSDEPLTPENLEQFSDEQLWAVVHRQFVSTYDLRLHTLTTAGKERPLTAEETEEIETLIAYFDHYVLLRSKALVLLKQRGYDVEGRLKAGA